MDNHLINSGKPTPDALCGQVAVALTHILAVATDKEEQGNGRCYRLTI